MLRDTIVTKYREDSNGVLYHYDTVRSLWISINREDLVFTRNFKKIVENQYLQSNSIYSLNNGFLINNTSRIVQILASVKEDTTGTLQIEVLRSGSITSISTVILSSQSTYSDSTVNFLLNSNDILQCKVVSGEFSYPIVTVTVAKSFS
jgi:hypothetical protein